MMRKLCFGMIGGGGGFIGNVHRHGALDDDLAVLTAGCFSRDAAKNRAVPKNGMFPAVTTPMRRWRIRRHRGKTELISS